MSKYVFGDLVKNSDLERTARLKAKPIIEKTVDKPQASLLWVNPHSHI